MGQSAHRLVMERKPPQTVIMLALGLGQTIAFASSFYLMGVLGDDIAADLALPPTFVFSLMSVALAASALIAPAAGRWVDRHGGKGMLLVSNLVFAAASRYLVSFSATIVASEVAPLPPSNPRLRSAASLRDVCVF